MKFDHVRVCQAKGITEWLPPDGGTNLRMLLANLEADPLMVDLRWMAYAMATVLRECGPAFKSIAEYASKQDPGFLRYETGTLGQMLGNTQKGDGMLFKGRGFVQLTGRANYKKFQDLIREPLISQPALALRPDVAYKVLSLGMTRGLFTGKKLGDYINGGGCDYLNARRIINGLDHAADVSASARVFESALRGAIL